VGQRERRCRKERLAPYMRDRNSIGAGCQSLARRLDRVPRALAQVGIGVVAGAVILAVFESLGRSTLTGVPLLAVSRALMRAAGVVACTVPVTRALKVQPTEAIAAGG
jgi:hypothetical protein